MRKHVICIRIDDFARMQTKVCLLWIFHFTHLIKIWAVWERCPLGIGASGQESVWLRQPGLGKQWAQWSGVRPGPQESCRAGVLPCRGECGNSAPRGVSWAVVWVAGAHQSTRGRPSASARPDVAWKNRGSMLPLKSSPVLVSPCTLETVFLDTPSQRRWGDFWVLPFSSVTQSCRTLCDPMDCSTPGFPVLHHLPELAPTLGAYVHANFCVWGGRSDRNLSYCFVLPPKKSSSSQVG